MEEQQSPPEPDRNYPYPVDDEINLLDYLIVLLKHKWRIAYIVIIAGFIAVIYSLQLPNIYRSEATIIPRQEEKTNISPAITTLRDMGGFAELIGLGGGGSSSKFQIVLKSRHLSRRIVEKYHLMPQLFEENWDPKKKIWIENLAPTFQDAYRDLMGMLTISIDRKSDVLSIKFDHKDRHFAKEMIDYYITELSESLRKETLKDAEENQRFLRRQLERTPDVLLKEKIYALLAKEIEKETFARAQKYYSFQVLDPPIVPDLNKKVKPKRSLICMLSVLVAFFVAVFLAFFLEYIHNLQINQDPERLEKLKNSLKLRSSGNS